MSENQSNGKSESRLPNGYVLVANSRNTVPTGRQVVGPAMPLKPANPPKAGGKWK